MGESNRLAFDPPVIAVTRTRKEHDLHDRYFVLLCFVPAGYATFGEAMLASWAIFLLIARRERHKTSILPAGP